MVCRAYRVSSLSIWVCSLLGTKIDGHTWSKTRYISTTRPPPSLSIVYVCFRCVFNMFLPRRFALIRFIELYVVIFAFSPFRHRFVLYLNHTATPLLATVYVHSRCVFNMFLSRRFVLMCSIEHVQSFSLFHPFGPDSRRISTTRPPLPLATARCVFNMSPAHCFVLMCPIEPVQSFRFFTLSAPVCAVSQPHGHPHH